MHVIDTALADYDFITSAHKFIRNSLHVEGFAVAEVAGRPALYVDEGSPEAPKVTLLTYATGLGLIYAGTRDDRPSGCRWFPAKLAAALLDPADIDHVFVVDSGERYEGGTLLGIFTNPVEALSAAQRSCDGYDYAGFRREVGGKPEPEVIARWWCDRVVDWVEVRVVRLNPTIALL